MKIRIKLTKQSAAKLFFSSVDRRTVEEIVVETRGLTQETCDEWELVATSIELVNEGKE